MKIITKYSGVSLLVILALVSLILSPIHATAADPNRPNIVVVLVDDLSTDAMKALLDGGWLPEIRTHLVDAGVDFKNSFVTNPECCPSRATLLRGQYSHNHQVLANHALNPLHGGIAWTGWMPDTDQAGHEDSTIATWLQDAGYRTGFIGKYLNGYGEQAPSTVNDPRTYVPAGWNEWNGLISQSAYSVYNYELNINGEIVHYGEDESDYQTDVLAAQASSFIESAQPEPFFLLVAPLAPHIEVVDPLAPVTGNDATGGLGLSIRPAPRHAHLIDGNFDNGEMPPLQMKPSFNENDLSDKPSCPRPLPPETPALISDPSCVAERPVLDEETNIPALEYQYKSMLASVIAVDDMVGTIVQSLDSVGKLENTVIIFTSDNGWFYGEHRLIGKELAYEESIRVPLIIRAPGGIKGGESQALVLNNDLAPTLADLAGITPPYDVDGASVMPLVDTNPVSSWHGRKRFLVERWYIPSLLKFDAPTYLALRTKTANQDYTFIATRADPDNFHDVTHREFYNLPTDPYQTQSIPLPDQINSSLENFLLLFRACRGNVCRAFESF